MVHSTGKKGRRLKSAFRPVAAADDSSAQEVPHVWIDGEGRDVHSQMLTAHRTIRIDGEISEKTAAIVCDAIRVLEKLDRKKPIHIVINSVGGDVSSGLAIIDTMDNCICPVHTYAYGEASSMAAVILAHGNKSYAAPNAVIMIHQPLGAAEGQETDVTIAAKDLARAREQLTDLLAKATGIPHETMDGMVERDNCMTAAKAKEYNIVDEIMTQEMYFRIVYKMDVPDYKKPRFPDNVRKTPQKSARAEFEEKAGKQARQARLKRAPRVPGNDNRTREPVKKAAPRPKTRKKRPSAGG